MSKDEVNCRYTDGVFTPEEIEAMTGVSPVTQRTWKARGLLGPRDKIGRGGFSAHDVVLFWALQTASQVLRVELSFVHDAIADAVPSILWWALSNEKAWDIEGTADQKAAFRRALSSADKEDLLLLDMAVGVKRERFGRYLVRYADGWKLVFDMEDFFSAEAEQAVLVLDLFAVANKLVASAKRPRGLMVASEIGDRPPPLRLPKDMKPRRK
jgi:hypothetical protein